MDSKEYDKNMSTLIFCFLFWVLFAFTEGLREAYIRNEEKKPRLQKAHTNLQLTIISQRILILILIGWNIFSNMYSCSGGRILLSVSYIIGMSFMFIFINNNTYFAARNNLNPDIFVEDEKSNCLDISERPMIYLNYTIRRNLFIIGLTIEIVVWILFT